MPHLTSARAASVATRPQPRPVVVQDLPVSQALEAAERTRTSLNGPFLAIKYAFILINVIQIIVAAYLLYSSEWNPENALLILLLIFNGILSVVAVLGSFKEECYLVLTYGIGVTLILLATVIFFSRSILEELSILVYVLFSFLFAFMLFRRSGPVAPLTRTERC